MSTILRDNQNLQTSACEQMQSILRTQFIIRGCLFVFLLLVVGCSENIGQFPDAFKKINTIFNTSFIFVFVIRIKATRRELTTLCE